MVSITCSTRLEARSSGDSMRGEALADLRTEGCTSFNELVFCGSMTLRNRGGSRSTIVQAAATHGRANTKHTQVKQTASHCHTISPYRQVLLISYPAPGLGAHICSFIEGMCCKHSRCTRRRTSVSLNQHTSSQCGRLRVSQGAVTVLLRLTGNDAALILFPCMHSLAFQQYLHQ